MIKITDHSMLAPFVAASAQRLHASLLQGNVARGAACQEFTHAVAAGLHVDSNHVTAVNSGTTALIVALLLLNKPGRTVVIPKLSYAATRSAVVSAGMTPVVADVDADGLLDVNDAATVAESYNAAAIIAVELFGQTFATGVLERLQLRVCAPVVVDAAQSWGSHSSGIPPTLTRALSFSANKPWPTFDTLGALYHPNHTSDTVRPFLHHGINDSILDSGVRGYASESACCQALATRAPHPGPWGRQRIDFSQRVQQLAPVLTVWNGRPTNWHKLVLRLTPAQAVDINKFGVECRPVYDYCLDGTPGPSLYQIPNRGNLTEQEQRVILTALKTVLT